MADYGIVAKMFGDALFSGDRLNQQKAYADQQLMLAEQMERDNQKNMQAQEALRKQKNLLMEAAMQASVRHVDRQQYESFIDQGYEDLMADIKNNHHGNFQSWLNFVDGNGNNGYDKLDQLVNNPGITNWNERQESNAKWMQNYLTAATDPTKAHLISRQDHSKYAAFKQETKSEKPTLHELGAFSGLKAELDHSYLDEMTIADEATWMDAAYHNGNAKKVARNIMLDTGMSQDQALQLFDNSPEGNQFLATYMQSNYGQIGERGKKELEPTIAMEYAKGLKSLPNLGNDWSGDYQQIMDQSGASLNWNLLGMDEGSRMSWTGFANKQEKRVKGSAEIITDNNLQLSTLQSVLGNKVSINKDGSITLTGVDMLREGNGVYTENGNRLTTDDLATTSGLLTSIGGGTAAGAGGGAIIGGGILSVPASVIGGVTGGVSGGLAYYGATEQQDMDLEFNGFYIANKWTHVDDNGNATDQLAMEWKNSEDPKARDYNDLYGGSTSKPVMVIEMRDKEIFDDVYYLEIELNQSVLANINNANKDINTQLKNNANAGENLEVRMKRQKRNMLATQKSAEMLSKRFGGGDVTAVDNIVKYFAEPINTHATALGVDKKAIPLILAEIMVTSEKDPEGNDYTPMQTGQLIQQKIQNLPNILQQPSYSAWLDAFKSGDNTAISQMYNMGYDQKTKTEIYTYAKMFSNLMK